MKILLAFLFVALTACAAENDTRAAEKGAAPPASPAVPTPIAEPAPPAGPVVPSTPAPKTVDLEGRVDIRCATSADCEVKNVGNCCGYFPACVNKDSPVFPDQVRMACEREGRASICGFREISSCQCVTGQCQAADGGGSSVQ